MKKILIYTILSLFVFLMMGLQGDTAEVFDIDITGEVETKYNDNITTSKDNELDDLITAASIGLVFTQEGETHDLEVQGQIFQEIYWDHDEYNNVGEHVKLVLNKEFSENDRIKIIDNFYNAEETEDFEEEFGREVGRYRYFRNRAELEYEREINSRLTLNTLYGNEIYEVNRDDLKDSVAHRVRFGLPFATGSNLRIGPFYQWSTREFDPGNDSTTHLIGATLLNNISERLYLFVVGGVSLIEDFNGDDLEEPYYEATLTNQVGKKTTAKLSFRQAHTTTSSTEDVFDSWRCSITFIQDLLERLSLELSAFYGEGDYVRDDVEDDLIGFSTTLNFEVLEDIETFLRYGYSQTDSNDASREYERNVVSLGVRFRF